MNNALLSITFKSLYNGGFMSLLTADSQGMLFVIFASAVFLSAIVGYLLGSVNSSIIISRVLYRDDVRSHGSGNAGMTNMLRTYGTAAAGLTLLGDVLKTVIAVFCGAMICGAGLGGYVAGTLCVFGHIFPIYYKFRGGKGVLCAATMIAMLSPWVFLICFGFFLIIVLCTRYVSLGSVIGAATYPLLLIRLYGNGIGNVFAVIVAVLIIICHRKNLGRLWRGEESKISFKRKGSVNAEKNDGEDK